MKSYGIPRRSRIEGYLLKLDSIKAKMSQKAEERYKNRRFNVTCLNCGKNFTVPYWRYKRGVKFCSKKCYDEWIRRNAKYEKTLGYESNYWYKVIRPSILLRDGYKCQICGSRENLQIHHIIPYKAEGGNNHENLITLCARCHRLVEVGKYPFTYPLSILAEIKTKGAPTKKIGKVEIIELWKIQEAEIG